MGSSVTNEQACWFDYVWHAGLPEQRVYRRSVPEHEYGERMRRALPGGYWHEWRECKRCGSARDC